jgi:hypothetical protein
VKYEAAVHQYLLSIYGGAYIPAPWFVYQEVGETRVRFCQPDGLLFDAALRRLVIVEVKLRHTEKAWWQLKKKYRPIVEFVYPWMDIAYCEVVQWFDVSIPFPEYVELRPAVRMAKPDEVQVTIWKP